MQNSINPMDIPDPNVREWYMNQAKSSRRWLMPIWRPLLERKHYLGWVFKEIFAQSDAVTLMSLENDIDTMLFKRVRELRHPKVKIISSHHAMTADDLRSVIASCQINSFFSHANFSPAILMMQQELIKDPLVNQVLSVWHEGGFLRHVCFQLDWMGWNALSSLAMLDVASLPPLTNKQNTFLDSFMNDVFIRNKYYFAKKARFFQSLSEIQKFCSTNKPVSVIPLQVHRDSVIVHFAPDQYLSLEWAFEFAAQHLDHFFVIIDHPLQRNFEHLPEHYAGENWIFLPHSSGIDTTSLCKHANSVVTVNSTVGFEALHWSPVFRGGRSVYSHDGVSTPIENFPISDSRELVNRFLYYAITKFHYTPNINAHTQRDWFNILDINKRAYLRSEFTHSDAKLPKKSSISNFDFLTAPKPTYDHLRAGSLADYFADHFIVPYSTVLDIGGGHTRMAKFFYDKKRAKCTIVDIKELASNESYADYIQGDFLTFASETRFDAIWTSHVFEHITNKGQFLSNAFAHASESAVFAIVVPKNYYSLVGGHINIFTPATLCYNIVLAGQDLSNATVIVQDDNIGVFWKRNDFELPKDLKYDKGDIEVLADKFPRPVFQGINAMEGWQSIRAHGYPHMYNES